jgi:DDE family transposase
MSRAGRTRSKPNRRDHRQPKRQERGKRGACIDPPGFDAGKKIKGKKRHLLVDTQGLLLHAIVHSADIQDRDGGVLVMATLFGMYPFLLALYADAGYQGPLFQRALLRVVRKHAA